jgi:hypothetical protein
MAAAGNTKKQSQTFLIFTQVRIFGARRSVQTSRRCGEKKNFPLGLDHLQFRIIYKTRYERGESSRNYCAKKNSLLMFSYM